MMVCNMGKEKRNGTIELLRFIFCMAVLFFHISMDIYGTDWRQISWGGYFDMEL